MIYRCGIFLNYVLIFYFLSQLFKNKQPFALVLSSLLSILSFSRIFFDIFPLYAWILFNFPSQNAVSPVYQFTISVVQFLLRSLTFYFNINKHEIFLNWKQHRHQDELSLAYNSTFLEFLFGFSAIIYWGLLLWQMNVEIKQFSRWYPAG